ncbi:ORF6N domain-containing protein [Solibacillus sp. FSL W7-1472]|uniref:ORF6N domain-containing protein n=1 Tax=Solibacillus sp. FSL W7-1472 TaxID=2921707 RepID=UPI0030DD28BA
MTLQIIEREGKRVLMTSQIAEAFGADTKTVNRNFQRNQERFVQGLHFYALTGEALKHFKGERQNDATLKFASNLYLWTEEGAFMLAKSLNNDKAWHAYNLLVSQYFQMTKQLAQDPTANELSYNPERFMALEQRVKEIELQLLLVTLHTWEQKRLQKAINERVYELCDVKARRPAYFSELYRAIKKRYHVDSYRDVPQCQLQDALLFVQNWGGIQT